jgi:hypothetical protein
MTVTNFTLLGQSKDTWTSFWNKDTTLMGFKDKNGIVKIEPKFKGFTSANKFDDIIAVTESMNENWNSYYLTKAGRIVGKDSLHIFDNGADCESEGYIRFRDPKTDKVGMFNRNGDIVVPAEYNDLTRVRNGMIIALKGAEKKQWGEHFSWKGGKEILINTNNKILVDNFKFANNLNFFSVLISSQPATDSIRQNFKGVNGQYYSFIDFDKEFWKWLKSSLLDNFTKNSLLESTYKEITFWKEPDGWTSEAKSTFIDRNFELIRTKLVELNSKDCDYTIFDEGLNPYIYDSEEYKDYYNNCGESKDWVYPIKNIVISYKVKKGLLQNHFDFLRTDVGYKLISVTIRQGELK